MPVNGAKVLLVGLSYKRNTGDIRESPSLRIIELLAEYGAEVSAADDHVEDHRWPVGVARVQLTAGSVAGADAVVLITDHDDFDLDLLAAAPVPVLDTRNRVTGTNVATL